MELQKINGYELFPAWEGQINQWYGKIGSGKTYLATRCIIKQLEAGQVVYANWRIEWPGWNQLDSKFCLLLGSLGLKKNFWFIPRENFHYIPFLEINDFIQNKLPYLTDCSVWLDEGHLAFDSYELTRMGIEKRASVLHTRHFDRSINVISQRSTAIHASLRGNVSVFYKCEKILDFWKLLVFRLSEYQDMDVSERPNEELPPENESIYFGLQKYFKMYSSKYIRSGLKTSQFNLAGIHRLSPIECRQQLKNKLRFKND